jgi:hypothetical protein
VEEDAGAYRIQASVFVPGLFNRNDVYLSVRSVFRCPARILQQMMTTQREIKGVGCDGDRAEMGLDSQDEPIHDVV